jgi:hypothetical protein
LRQALAWLAAALIAALAAFQVALAAGLPAASYAWGGRFDGSLPGSYRLASLAAVPMLALAAWVVLARADIVRPGARVRAIRIGAWIWTAFLALNTLGNAMSASASERLVMTPVSVTLLACFAVVASARRN